MEDFRRYLAYAEDKKRVNLFDVMAEFLVSFGEANAVLRQMAEQGMLSCLSEYDYNVDKLKVQAALKAQKKEQEASRGETERKNKKITPTEDPVASLKHLMTDEKEEDSPDLADEDEDEDEEIEDIDDFLASISEDDDEEEEEEEDDEDEDEEEHLSDVEKKRRELTDAPAYAKYASLFDEDFHLMHAVLCLRGKDRELDKLCRNVTAKEKPKAKGKWKNEQEFEEVCMNRIEAMVLTDGAMTRDQAVCLAAKQLIAVRECKQSREAIDVHELVLYEFAAASDDEYNMLKKLVWA